MDRQSREKYRAFCHAHPEIPVFYQDWYLDAVCQGGAWSVVFAENNGDVEAVWPYFYKKKWGFHYVTMPHFVKYMGIWEPVLPMDLSRSHQRRAQLLQQLPVLDAFMQNFHPSFQNWLPFYWEGYRQETRYTYTLDISDLEVVIQGVNRNMRRNIQKANAVVGLEHSTDARRFYQMNQLSFARQGLPMPYSEAAFRAQDAALAAHGQRQIFFAVDQGGNTHSAAYLIWDKHSAYYHLSGDDPAWRSSGAGIWLLWQCIRFARETLGLTHFDFEGSVIREVEAIRRQFGAVQTPYFFIWKNTHGLLRWWRARG